MVGKAVVWRALLACVVGGVLGTTPLRAQDVSEQDSTSAPMGLGLGGIGGLAMSSASESLDGPLPDGWNCTGNCGVLGPNGVVVAPPNGATSYLWVSTYEGAEGVNLPGVGGSGFATNGSRAISPTFNGMMGDRFSFFFNYVTSDGAGYADYGWARLLNAGGDQVALLFTARTTPGGSTVPGFSMPAPTVTLDPATVLIVPGGPSWSPLGFDSGSCFDQGCGYTGWVRSDFTLSADGSYRLEFGATNWTDRAFDSGMAVAGLALNDVAIPVNPGMPPIVAVPEPGTVLLVAAGLGLLVATRRRMA
jgi:hypothetical protein